MPDTPTGAVFLSYASQDAEAVRRVCEALRAAGIEVWFDQNELVGGDAWDAKIRGQIASCALFVPVISAATQARREGYFRIEWRLAAQRTHAMADGTAFLLPVVIDDTRDADALVPAEFKSVQWTRLPGGATPTAFCDRVRRLLRDESAPPPAAPAGAAARSGTNIQPGWLPARVRRLVATLIAVAATIGLVRWHPWRSDSGPTSASTVSSPTAKGLTEAQQLVEKARKSIDEGDELNPEIYALAEDLLKRAEQIDPDEASAWALHAWVSAELMRYAIDRSDARRAAFRTQASRAAALDPEAPDVQLASARAKIQVNSNRSDLKPYMDDLVRRLADHPGAYRCYAFANPRSEEALALLRAAIDKWPTDRRLPGDLVQLQLVQGNYAGALEFLLALPAPKHTGRTLSALAFLQLWWLGDPAAARRDIARWPEWLLAENRGVAFTALTALRGGAPTDALKALRKLPRAYLHDSFFTGPRSVLTAWAYEQGGQTDAARAEWRLAITACDQELQALPGDAAALHWKAWALARLGETDAALALFRPLVGRSPVSIEGLPQIAGGLAGLALELGDRAEALRQIELLPQLDAARTRPMTRAALDLTPFLDPIRDDPVFIRFRDSLPAPAHALTPTAPPEKSVAVLAFANLSDDKSNEYFSDGISEELLNVLAKVPGLKVSARTSAFSFKGKNTPVPEIAKQLGVAYVVEGSVRKAGDKVRIAAQLIKAEDGFQVWSDTFTRDVRDVFALQDEIAALVAQNLKLQLGAVSGAAKVDLRAFELYYRARQLWNLRTLDAYEQAERLLEEAVAIDPRFARAHAAIADVWSLRGQALDTTTPWGRRDSAEIARIIEKCQLALRLDPESAEVRSSLGLAYWGAWRLADAESELRAAVRLNPAFASAHQWLGRVLLTSGDMDGALSELRRAAELDPLAARILDNQAWALVLANRLPEAREVLDRALAIQPNAVQAIGLKAVVLVDTGEIEAGARLARTLSDQDSLTAWLRMIALARARKTAEIRETLPRMREGNDFAGFSARAALGEVDEALNTVDPRWLSSTRVDWLLFHPLYDGLRGDPRLRDLLRTVGLTEAHARAQAWRAAHHPERSTANP